MGDLDLLKLLDNDLECDSLRRRNGGEIDREWSLPLECGGGGEPLLDR
jgi:hypothetical protein